ncbi:sensor histidine kinase [Streptomyces zhihengii]|uniref:sensor histidine kinase n=1 Tax=Streptomyces zhihengii TaxID=1818004 RepID=UPI0036413FD6
MKRTDAPTARIAWQRRLRRALTSPWSRGRIAGECVVTTVQAGLPGLLDAMVAGFTVRTLLVVVGVALLSLARRTLPATVLVLAAVTAAELPAASLLLVYASWSAGRRVERPGRMAAAYGCALVLYTALSTHNELRADSELPLVTGALSTAVFLVLAVVPGLVGRYRAQRRSLLLALRHNNEQLVREQAMVAHQARLLERGRIARDMHDSLGHQLALISVHAGALQVDPDLTERQREGVRILREASVAAMGELREAVGILHDVRDRPGRGGGRTEPGGAGAGLVPAAGGEQPRARAAASVEELVASSRAAGATVELHRSGTVRQLAPAADHAAYRIAQEGLTNAHKHAPGAPIAVALRYEADSLVVEVANGPAPAGTPAAPAGISGGQGLTGLRERARLVGGMVHTGATADGGFRVAGMLPYGAGHGEAPPRPHAPEPAGAAAFAAPVSAGGPGAGYPGNVHPGAGYHGGPAAPGPYDGFAAHPGAANGGGAAPVHGEFAAIMSSRRNLAVGCAVTGAVLVVGVIAMGVWGVSALMDEVDKAMIPVSVYESARPGDPEAVVQEKLPAEDSFLTADLATSGPPIPEGATCRHFASDDPDDFTTVFRFCFRDGKLVSKETFDDAP